MKMHPLCLLTAVAFLPLLSPSAYAGKPNSSCAPKTNCAPTSCCASDAKTCLTPAQFADKVATVNMLEIKLGQIAQTNAGLPSVKKFGADMVKGHTALQADLAKVAASQNIALPTKLDAKHLAILKKLSALKGAAFDQTYIPAMVEGHTKVLAMFNTCAGKCSNPAIQKFAKKNASAIAMHLKMAKKVKAQMIKDGQLSKAACQTSCSN